MRCCVDHRCSSDCRVSVAVVGSCSFSSTPSLETYICHRCGPKKAKKKCFFKGRIGIRDHGWPAKRKIFSIWYFIEKFTKFCPSQFGSLMTLGHSLCSPSSRPTPFHSLQFLAVTSTSQACSCPEAFTPTLFSAWNVLSRIFAQLAPLSSSSLHSNNLLSGALSNHLICNYNPPGYTP